MVKVMNLDLNKYCPCKIGGQMEIRGLAAKRMKSGIMLDLRTFGDFIEVTIK